ncbi:MAG: three-Cys-motif partner protein TcmP [Anaerolineae bacterium]|nr:three-Cys-motif partner protein TcmP [Anaerolineae bacterium]
MSLEPRPTQTRIKHEILQEYLKSWGYIITGGLRSIYSRVTPSSRKLTTRFVYVDCFAYKGAYAPENGIEVFGSPIIGIDSLDRLAHHFVEQNGVFPDTYAILVEEDKENYRFLLNLLNNKYPSRVRETTDLSSLQSGEIAIINDDYTHWIDQISDFTGQQYTWTFYLLDPYGPKGLQLDVVGRIISQEHADVIINLMYQDLHKKTGSAAKAQPYQGHTPHLEYWDRLYGSQGWRQISDRYYTGQIDKEQMEADLVDLYRKVLMEYDASVAVKRIPLKFEDRDRTMFYLFLTTHDGTGALKMNEILDGAKIKEYDYRQEARTLRTLQPTLFDLDPHEDPLRPQPGDHDIDEVARLIHATFAGKTVTFREVLAALADRPFYEDQVKKAMTRLKKSNTCHYDKLSHREQIRFT